MKITYTDGALDSAIYYPYGIANEWYGVGAFDNEKYGGEIYLPDRAADAVVVALTLHEMAHVLQGHVIGVERFIYEYQHDDPVPFEAQASALALAWIAPEYYAEAYEYLAGALDAYLDDKDDWSGSASVAAYDILDAAIADVTTSWAEPAVDKRQLRLMP